MSEIMKPLDGPIEKPRPPKKRIREGNDDQYKRAVKLLPCCTCRTPGPSDPHHLKQGTGERGMGLKSTDKWLVPLCGFPSPENCHGQVESIASTNEREWFAQRGIDSMELAQDLWAAWRRSGSRGALMRVLQEHWNTDR